MRVVDHGGDERSDEWQVGTVYRNKDDRSLHLCVRLDGNIQSSRRGVFLMRLEDFSVGWWSEGVKIGPRFAPVTATLTVGGDP